jgi:acetyltransferase-like isoleucine patch superfamily enzyme
MRNTNIIDDSSYIHPKVKLGDYNRIGKNVKIDIVGKGDDIVVNIGDNNIINDNTRIIINKSFSLGDWNVLHNDMLIMATDDMSIGHNCWFGQNTILDATGGLQIGNGVRIGMYSQIWTHVASGEQIEGCNLYAMRKTIIEDDVWLVGSCIVGSGLHLGRRSTALINSVLTKDTEADRVYAGSPAKLMEKANFYDPITLDQKFELLNKWLKEFVEINPDVQISQNEQQIILKNTEDSTIFTMESNKNDVPSYFFLSDKTFNKSNSELERRIYKFLYNNKARFLPN